MEGGIRVLVPFACCNGISVMLLLYASGVAVILLSHYTSPNSNRRIPTWQSKDITQIFALLAEFGEASNPTRWWAEIILPLSKLPEWMQWWRPKALQFQQRQDKVWMGYWQDLKNKMEEGRAPECFVKQFA